jgi:hypothetical protein
MTSAWTGEKPRKAARERITISKVKKAADTTTTDIDVALVLNAIRTGGKKLCDQIGQIRSTFAAEVAFTRGNLQKAKVAVEQLKKALPGVTWSGRFSYRASGKLLQHSGLFCADLDLLGKELLRIGGQLKASPHLFALFLSPTVYGLKAIFRVPADGAKHAASFRAVEAHVKQLTGVQIDESCKDAARLCFLSYDPQIYVNENAIELEPLPEKEKPNPAFNSSGEVNLSERQRIAGELLGNIDWQSETSGFVQCPGKHLHTSGDGGRDCKFDCDGVPTVHCFHNHCRGILDGVNRELRSQIGKAEFVPTPRDGAKPRSSEPAELPPPPAPYVPPPLDLLPQVLRDYVQAAAASLDVSETYVFQPLLPALAAHIGNSRSILLKAGYVEPSVIWSGIIGPSGSLKSPAIAAGCLASMELERELRRQNNEANEIYEDEIADWEIANKKLRGPKPEKPGLLRHVTDDLTIEVLADLLTANPRGLLIRKDELSQWFASFDQYRSGKGSDVGRWLSLHTGVFFAVDRRSDNRHYTIFDPRVSINGGIQPKTLRRVLTEDFFERGLPARFLFAYPPADRPHQWTEATVPEKLITEVLQLFERLWLLAPRQDNGHAIPEMIALAPEAKELFVTFYNATFRTARVSDEREEAAWAKLPGQAARLALVGQLAHDPAATTISGEVMQAACKLAEWFGHEAARIYGELSESEQARERRELVEFIRKRGGSVTVRDIMQLFRPLKNNRDEAERQLTALVRAKHGEWIETKGKRGPSTREFQLLQVSTSTGFKISPSIASKPVDVDSPNSRKITPSREPDTSAETLVRDESEVARL